MNTKMLVGGVIGGVVFFLLGWLLYGMLLMDTMAQYSNAACARPMEEMNMGLMVAANLFWGLAFSYILSNWSGTMSIATGATAGAIVGLLIGVAYDLMMYSTTSMMTSLTAVGIDVVVTAIMCAISGAAIAWWLARK